MTVWGWKHPYRRAPQASLHGRPPYSRSAPGLFTKLREVGKPRFPQASSGKGGNCGPRRRASAVATSLDLRPHIKKQKKGRPAG